MIQRKTKKPKRKSRELGNVYRRVVILHKVIRKGPLEKGHLSKDLREEKEAAGQIAGERTFQAEKTAGQRPQGKSIPGWLE